VPIRKLSTLSRQCLEIDVYLNQVRNDLLLKIAFYLLAYISQTEKKELAPAIKKVLKAYGMKGTLSINHYSTLAVNLKKGSLDLIGAAQKKNNIYSERHGRPVTNIGSYYQANAYSVETAYDQIDSKIGQFYKDLVKAMKGTKWFDKSDLMTDYHYIAYYLNINVGKWDKPYEFIGA